MGVTRAPVEGSGAAPAWTAKVLTLFPEAFPGPLGCSLAGQALNQGLWALETVDIRGFASDKHRTVDDAPFGGGPGMGMRPDLADAGLAAPADARGPGSYLSPRGRPLRRARINRFLNVPVRQRTGARPGRVPMNEGAIGSIGADQLFARLPQETAESLTAEQRAAIRRAARLADCWYINPHHTLTPLERKMELYKRALDGLRKPFPPEEPLRREVVGLMKRFIVDYDTVVKSRESALPHMLAAHRRVWSQDLPLQRFIARTR